MKKALESLELEIFDMNESKVCVFWNFNHLKFTILKLNLIHILKNQNAFCDGGDVLFTGSEFFVGHSKRTTPEGANFLRESFGLPVHVIDVGSEGNFQNFLAPINIYSI